MRKYKQQNTDFSDNQINILKKCQENPELRKLVDQVIKNNIEVGNYFLRDLVKNHNEPKSRSCTIS